MSDMIKIIQEVTEIVTVSDGVNSERISIITDETVENIQVIEQSMPGAPGDAGLSAYQVAVVNGFVGSELAWLASLVGPPGSGGAWGSLTGTLSSQTDLQSALNAKETANANIQTHISSTSNPHSVTKTQVGLGSVVNADTTTTANITDATNKRFVTDANLVTIGNQSGTNTGDETITTIKSKLGITTLSGSNTGDQSLAGLVPTTTTVNGHPLSANVTVTKGDVGLGSVVNSDTTTTANITDATNKRFVTDANLTTIGNQSGTNTGDNATNSQYSGLATSKQDTLVSGTNIKTINSLSILGSGNLSISASMTEIEVDFGTSPVTNKEFTITDASVSPSSMVMVCPSGNPATGRIGNDYSWDAIHFSAVPGSGQFIISALAMVGTLVGKRKVLYEVG